MKITKSNVMPDGLPEPDESENERIAEVRRRCKSAKRVRISLEGIVSEREGDDPDADPIKVMHMALGPPHSDVHGWMDVLKDALGSPSKDFAHVETSRLVDSLRDANGVAEEIEVNAALAAVDGMHATDELEAQLAVQMAATHSLAMKMLGQARRAAPGSLLGQYGNIAVKLLRTYTAQIEALAKLRRGGRQVVIVKHLHVNDGGQAIVGNVTTAPQDRGDGGASDQCGDQTHGQAGATAQAIENGATVWGEDAGGWPMSETGQQGKEALPISRRSGGDGSASG